MSLPWRSATLGLVLATSTASIVSVSAQAGDPLAGTWELRSGTQVRETRTYEVTGQQEKMTSKGINAQGKPTLVQYAANRDGKDYPVTGHPAYNSISWTPVDAFTATYTTKVAGKAAFTGRREISKDGKTLTISWKGVEMVIEGTFVFDKR